jgi:hypothetical protein
MSEGQQTLHSRAPAVFNVSLVLAIVATVFVILRIISKWVVVKRNNSDDVFTVIAWVSGCVSDRGSLRRMLSDDVAADAGPEYFNLGRSKVWTGGSGSG